jgi:hypothetical protein
MEDEQRVATRKKGGMLWPLYVVGVGVLIAGPALFAPSCEGFEDDAITALNACSLAAEALGGKGERVDWGFQLNSSKTKRGQQVRHSKTDVLVRGPKGDGHLDVDAVRVEGLWSLRKAELRVGGRTIEITRCGEATSATLDAPRTFTGKVKETTPSTPAPVGAPCTVQVKHEYDQVVCRAEVECGGQKLYGATPELGFHFCGYVATGRTTKALVALDRDRRRPRDESELWLDERRGRVELVSQKGRDDWALTIELTPP